MGILQARILEWVTIPFSRGSSQPGFKPGSPPFQADSLPFEPPGKPGAGGIPLLIPFLSGRDLILSFVASEFFLWR